MNTHRINTWAFLFSMVVIGLVTVTILSFIQSNNRNQNATGTELQTRHALDTCGFRRNPIADYPVHTDPETGAVWVNHRRGHDFEDCLVQNIQDPQNTVTLHYRSWMPLPRGYRDDVKILGEADRAAAAEQHTKDRIVHDDRARFLRQHIAGYIADQLGLDPDAVSVEVTEAVDGSWRHPMIIDLDDTDVGRRTEAMDLVEQLRQSQSIMSDDPVIVRATGWPDLDL